MATTTTCQLNGGQGSDWTGSITLDRQTGTTVTINNDKKYLADKIKLTVGARTGKITPAINTHTISTQPNVTGALSGTGTNIGTTTTPSGTDGTDFWTFIPTGNHTAGVSKANAKATVNTTGWIQSNPSNSSDHTISITPIVNNGAARYIPKGGMSGSITNAAAETTVSPGDISMSTVTKSVSGHTQVTISPTVSTSDISGSYYLAYYIDVPANTTGATSSISGSGTVTVGTAGYMPKNTSCTVSASGTARAKTSQKTAVYYVPLPNAAVSVTGGGLSATGASKTPAISITMPTSTVGASITSTSQSAGYYIKLTSTSAATNGVTTVTRAAVNLAQTAGYLPARSASSTINSTTSNATVTINSATSTSYVTIPSATVSVTGGGLTPTGITKTPAISITMPTYNISSASITSTSPSSGYYLKLVSTSAADSGATTVARANINLAQTAGYLPARTNSSIIKGGNSTASVTINSGTSTSYVTLPTANVSVTGGGLSASNATKTPSITITMPTYTVDGATITTTSQSSGYYLKLVSTTAANSGTTTVTRADVNLAQTAGYLTARTNSSIIKGTTQTAKVTINSATVTSYVTLPTAQFSVSDNSVYCSSRGWSPTGSTSSTVGTVATGSISNNTSGGSPTAGTVNWGKQIKIGKGYYGSDTYYVAQAAPSGNIQLTQATTTTVTNYATATVRGVTAAISGGGLSGTATASGSGVSLSDSTNGSGVSIVTACTASRAKVSCTASTAGWASGTIKELAAGSTAMTAKTYYINGVTLTAPSSGERTFSITVPNGTSSTVTFTFHVDKDSNVTVSES